MIELFLTRVRDVATSWKFATASTDAVDPKALSMGKSRVKILFGLSSGREYMGQLYVIVRSFGDGRSSSNKIASTASFGGKESLQGAGQESICLGTETNLRGKEDV